MLVSITFILRVILFSAVFPINRKTQNFDNLPIKTCNDYVTETLQICHLLGNFFFSMNTPSLNDELCHWAILFRVFLLNWFMKHCTWIIESINVIGLVPYHTRIPCTISFEHSTKKTQYSYFRDKNVMPTYKMNLMVLLFIYAIGTFSCWYL